MKNKLKITSRSQLKKNEVFDLKNFNNLFVKKKKKYKHKETIKFKDKIFLEKK